MTWALEGQHPYALSCTLHSLSLSFILFYPFTLLNAPTPPVSSCLAWDSTCIPWDALGHLSLTFVTSKAAPHFSWSQQSTPCQGCAVFMAFEMGSAPMVAEEARLPPLGAMADFLRGCLRAGHLTNTSISFSPGPTALPASFEE